MTNPRLIQGGMGIGVSNWKLARAVSTKGHLGVVSGTGIDGVLVRRLQSGDPDESMRRALSHFPDQTIASRILDTYFVSGGIPEDKPYKRLPLSNLNPSREHIEVMMAANFCEVFLAKENQDGLVGINFLEKLQMSNLASIYGAMLAGVDYVLMGAGIPREIPGVLDTFVNHETASLRVPIKTEEGSDDSVRIELDPTSILSLASPLKRPKFLAIIASVVLAKTLARKATGHVDGFIVEGPTAGGHNAPPRGSSERNEVNEPVWTEKDDVDLEVIRSIGRPFWLAGAYDSPGQLEAARAQGAEGIQLGTLFAFCEESGIVPELKQQVLASVADGSIRVHTDGDASPTGFPFKVVQLDGTLSDADQYENRPRACDLGYLRVPIRMIDGAIQYLCPSEPIDAFERKCGNPTEAEGSKCLCNALFANIGFGQLQKNAYREQALITAGKTLESMKRFLDEYGFPYRAEDVIHWLEPQPATS